MENSIKIEDKLIKLISDYCNENSINDINGFINRCTKQGFNIVRFGLSPKDNLERQNKGIKDIEENEESKENIVGHSEKEERPREKNEQSDERKENTTERVGESVKIVKKKIRVIKKDKK